LHRIQVKKAEAKERDKVAKVAKRGQRLEDRKTLLGSLTEEEVVSMRTQEKVRAFFALMRHADS
jgi:hypothetical protein